MLETFGMGIIPRPAQLRFFGLSTDHQEDAERPGMHSHAGAWER